MSRHPKADLYMAEREKGKTYREIAKMYGVTYQAVELANIQRMLGNQQMLEQYRSVAKCTERYTDARNLGGLNIAALQGRIGGGNDGSGASGDRLDRADRLSLL